MRFARHIGPSIGNAKSLKFGRQVPDLTETRESAESRHTNQHGNQNLHNRYADGRNCVDGECSVIFLIADAPQPRNGQQYRPIS